jgi:hypothetical protein
MDDADGIVLGIVGAERIRTDEFGEAFGPVRVGAARGTHFVKNATGAGFGDLPGGFAAGEAAADDVNGFHRASLGPEAQGSQ